MFTDIRGFTRMTEHSLAYDIVFVLNMYLGRMSEAVTDCGGYVDKFMGDGLMAIFGMDDPHGGGARDALAAARAMSGILEGLNHSLSGQIDEPLRIGHRAAHRPRRAPGASARRATTTPAIASPLSATRSTPPAGSNPPARTCPPNSS